MAARQLKTRLDWIVETLDEIGGKGKTDAEAWAWLQVQERRPTRQGISPTPGVLQAIRAYAERSTIDQRRFYRAWRLAELALQYARGTIRGDEAIRKATLAREDAALAEGTLEELGRRVGAARNERSKWQAAYNVLAWDADVLPVPETGRGRSNLDRLYVLAAQSGGKVSATRAARRE